MATKPTSIITKSKSKAVQGRVMGRPSLKTSEMIEEICVRIMDGQSIVQVCEARDMPSRDTIHHWLDQDVNFSDKYVRACKIRREGKFYSMETTARTEEDVNRARLLVDVFKWQLSKEDPKKYGDKVDHTTNGKDMILPIIDLTGLKAPE